jgi:hypothetical protein
MYNYPGNPFRPVDWRWLRAADLVEGRRRPRPPHDDDWVVAAMRFRRWLRQPDVAARPSPPGLPEAHALYAAPPSFRRWELEAWLLTREPLGQVAARCGLSPEAVEAYHAVFFDVRDCLDAAAYILNVVIGPKRHSGLTEADVDVLLKMRAYSYGPAALEELLKYYRDPPVVPARPEALGLDGFRRLCGCLLVRASVVVNTLRDSDKTPGKLAVLREAIDVLENGQAGGSDPALEAPLAVVAGRLDDALDSASQGVVGGVPGDPPEVDPPRAAGHDDPAAVGSLGGGGRLAVSVA